MGEQKFLVLYKNGYAWFEDEEDVVNFIQEEIDISDVSEIFEIQYCEDITDRITKKTKEEQ